MEEQIFVYIAASAHVVFLELAQYLSVSLGAKGCTCVLKYIINLISNSSLASKFYNQL